MKIYIHLAPPYILMFNLKKLSINVVFHRQIIKYSQCYWTQLSMSNAVQWDHCFI